ncbi:phosphatase PAP2 family protein [Cohnella algarum]|nr:phosphatase PAP2 family protein [Cohnella algarum]
MMRFYNRLHEWEGPLFLHVNIRWNRRTCNLLFAILSLIGGATFSLSFSALVGFMMPDPWRVVGWQSLAAVSLSHLPVVLAKRSMPRLRPYQVFPQARTGRRPLQDPSFPSGHTTAAFALLTPWMIAMPGMFPLLLAVGLGVALSRVYFGLHYPSDTAVGAMLGFLTALLMIKLIG